MRHAACIVSALLAMAVLLLAPTAQAQTELGETVTNVATLSYNLGNRPVTVRTPPASFVVEGRRTASTIEFFRYAPMAPDAMTTRINGSDFSPSGNEAGPFSPVGDALTAGGRVLDLSGDVPIVPASTYLAGELIIVRVTDPGQNGNPTRIETLTVTVVAETGDRITLRLYESGPDTGEFYAYFPSTSQQTAQFDLTLTVANETLLRATYVDRFDATEVSVDTALVDPYGRVFDSLTGTLVAGTTVTVVDAATGDPAEVFGVDGFSTYPSTIVTGTTVTDSSGLDYVLGAGQFLFPLMAPGEYRLLVTPPEGYSFPSIATSFSGLANAPFVIQPGSYSLDFTVDGSGPVTFDVPLDPAAELVVRKDALSGEVAVGDSVGYQITVDNRDTVPAQIRLRDVLPVGFRYVPGSATVEGQPVADPTVSGSGRDLTFAGGVIVPGQTIRVGYVATVSAGARNGEAINRAWAVDGTDRQVSNIAEEGVFVREDLMRSRLTIVGRVAEAACDADEDWARELEDGIGVAGVRIYMEDGSYVVTDRNGLFHFQDVTPGTHVVQIDTETLPQGYEAMECEENTRYAGRSTSKFVDSPGGVIWRANFYVRRTGEVVEAVEEETFNDAVEYEAFDQAWLDGQDDAIAWVYPDPSRTPSSQSVNIGVKHPDAARVELWLNGRKVSPTLFTGRDRGTDNSVAISRWRGVSIQNGPNRFEARVLDADGQLIETLENTIYYVTEARRATLIADQSVLVADGRTVPEVAVRIEDDAGRPVHAGLILGVDVDQPYTLFDGEEIEDETALEMSLAGNGGVAVGADGIARIKLLPTLETGRVTLRVRMGEGREEQIKVYLSPEKRDWIVVGLAEGTLGWEDRSGSGVASIGGPGDEVFTDGRVAFYAKGLVKGDWLLTLAVDTDTRRGASDGDFRREIDPNAYYTLYGDRTYQGYDAASRYPVFLKLEKQQFQFLFGDYNTGLNETELSRYSRRLSGVKVVYEGDVLSAVGFATDTDQGFVRDELAADGTSGPFRLSVAPFLAQSETITVETRDRFRPDEVLSVRTLTRYVDYEIDDRKGEIIFRRPIDATDPSFNPNVIVVVYETTLGTARDVTAGGRVAVRTEDNQLEVGFTGIAQGGGEAATGDADNLIGIDATWRVSDATEVRAEYAMTDRDSIDNGPQRGEALLIEAVHQTDHLAFAAYFREEGANFGLGQLSGATARVRRYGVTGQAVLSEVDHAETAMRTRTSAQFDAYREEDLSTGQERSVTQAMVLRDNQVFGLNGGVRVVEETLTNNEKRVSALLLAGARRSFPERGLTLSVQHEEPVFGKDASSAFPKRTLIGVDQRLTKWATLNVRHEAIDGEFASGQNTVVGVTLQPWTGAQAIVQTDMIAGDTNRQIGATVGLDQTIVIDERWTASLGAARRARVDGSDDIQNPVSDPTVGPLSNAPLSPLTGREEFTSFYGGLAYRDLRRVASARIEYRDSTLGERYTAAASAAQEVSQVLSFAGAGRITHENSGLTPDLRTSDFRLGVARRPRGEGLILLDRLDYRREEVRGVSDTWKLINNVAINDMASDATQWSAYWGVKYARTSINGQSYDGWTQLVGGQIRHDITKRFDIGFAASALWQVETDTVDYSWGPTLGFRPNENVWVSFGYNVEGFTDDDFDLAGYTRKGPYVKLRFKFDERSLQGLLSRISPTRD